MTKSISNQVQLSVFAGNLAARGPHYRSSVSSLLLSEISFTILLPRTDINGLEKKKAVWFLLQNGNKDFSTNDGA
jgi:hypothetical protein